MRIEVPEVPRYDYGICRFALNKVGNFFGHLGADRVHLSLIGWIVRLRTWTYICSYVT